MKDYINFEGLTHFFDKLFEKFAAIKHTHTKSEITDFTDFTDIEDRLKTLEEDIASLKSVLNDNDILVANNASN